MPVPKKRRSKSKKRMKIVNYRIDAPDIKVCPQCGAPTVSHQVCKACGTYKGRQIIKVKDKSEKSKKSEE